MASDFRTKLRRSWAGGTWSSRNFGRRITPQNPTSPRGWVFGYIENPVTKKRLSLFWLGYSATKKQHLYSLQCLICGFAGLRSG